MGAHGKMRAASGANGDRRLLHWCPGCNEVHSIPVAAGEKGPVWAFNGDRSRPTFHPSVRVFIVDDEDDNGLPVPPREVTICHYFITEGRIQFCGDSPHALAGQTVDLPDWPYAPGAYGGIDE